MKSLVPQNLKHPSVRPVRYWDLETIEQLLTDNCLDSCFAGRRNPDLAWQRLRRWFWLWKLLSWFPNPYQHLSRVYVAQESDRLVGAIQVSACNHAKTTWRVDRAVVDTAAGSQHTGSVLLRHCLERIRQARNWISEVDINDRSSLALYRQNGFQPLAQMTYWSLAPERLQEIAIAEPNLGHLWPVSNTDAQLLQQLDAASVPPMVRQVFDYRLQDFQTSLLDSIVTGVQQGMAGQETVSGYVFEPQRQVAIGYFQVTLSQEGEQPAAAQITVHPGYDWLYGELLCQIARIAQDFPAQPVQIASADYQSDRETYLEKLGAQRVKHTLMMSRSVWHKLRESKPVSLEALQLSEVLPGLQPSRTPIPSRLRWWKADRGQSHCHPNHSTDRPTNSAASSLAFAEDPSDQDGDGERSS
ncbi:GNAT family N-acetyltransferase [Geitlerinema sp. PCC 9228]|jgi:ribosomal protein S18 acetylase RimI-like enzyme|uniref:GNAT family N-acetyltransferase n=1 Tax=Geitlerinema sp. PCC 9228 TaxID=111611 RepID=UPI0008F9C8A9|nr:GNAT family N-acetyltransferase [Geitlerinema sp. PCC 9228]